MDVEQLRAIGTDPDRFNRLPAPIRLSETLALVDERPVPDPNGGRDPERDFFLRYAAPI